MHRLVEEAWTEVSWFGSVFFALFVLLLALVFHQWHFALQLVVASAAATLLTALIRTFYYKDRPNKEAYKSFYERLNCSSFPSLHAMRAWLLVVLVYFNYDVWLSLMAAAAAVFVSVSRYMIRKHFVSDIIAGAMFGVAIGFLMLLL